MLELPVFQPKLHVSDEASDAVGFEMALPFQFVIPFLEEDEQILDKVPYSHGVPLEVLLLVEDGEDAAHFLKQSFVLSLCFGGVVVEGNRKLVVIEKGGVLEHVALVLEVLLALLLVLLAVLFLEVVVVELPLYMVRYLGSVEQSVDRCLKGLLCFFEVLNPPLQPFHFLFLLLQLLLYFVELLFFGLELIDIALCPFPPLQ